MEYIALTRFESRVVKVTGSAASTSWHMKSTCPTTVISLLSVRPKSIKFSFKVSAVNST
jgi:hypothetical protein